GADDDLRALPRRACEFSREHCCDVDLDADRRAVALVRRPVGPTLERADVTEGAAVRATHVGVQRPLEHHPPHAVEGAPARLLAVLDPHGRSVEHTFAPTRPAAHRRAGSGPAARVHARAVTRLDVSATEVAAGVRRITLPLPTGPRHVHCYIVDGTLFDTGLGLEAPSWSELGIE